MKQFSSHESLLVLILIRSVLLTSISTLLFLTSILVSASAANTDVAKEALMQRQTIHLYFFIGALAFSAVVILFTYFLTLTSILYSLK
ncbi:hypothetical protein ACPUVO_06630 [Pseudocolwellia sp. HL-MZ19]|uniref:hypothetical protein n=1 Tax=unclassified Pseudocolwellia TaxID=2848178 RepID=UPI003CFAC544